MTLYCRASLVWHFRPCCCEIPIYFRTPNKNRNRWAIHHTTAWLPWFTSIFSRGSSICFHLLRILGCYTSNIFIWANQIPGTLAASQALSNCFETWVIPRSSLLVVTRSPTLGQWEFCARVRGISTIRDFVVLMVVGISPTSLNHDVDQLPNPAWWRHSATHLIFRQNMILSSKLSGNPCMKILSNTFQFEMSWPIRRRYVPWSSMVNSWIVFRLFSSDGH